MPRLSSSSSNFADCLMVGEAAEFLGVSTATLRNWDRSGKLKPRRHPHNGYRIYLHEDLEALLRSADLPALADEPVAPKIDWSKVRESGHFVQFYENDLFLMDSLTDYITSALKKGDNCIVIATPDHREALHDKLTANGIDLAQAQASRSYFDYDAATTLSQIMIHSAIDAGQFEHAFDRMLDQVSHRDRHVYAYCEMIPLLWTNRNRAAAIQLEHSWHKLAEQHDLTVFCAYPINGFNGDADADAFQSVCECHQRVIPAESYALALSVDQRLRVVSTLQQQAASLHAEIAHRHEVERQLSQQECELRDFFENAIDGLHKVGPDGTILWANKADYALLGYTSQEYVGHSISEFHADPAVIADILARFHTGESMANYPAQLLCKNGTIKHVLISASACFENGKFAHTRYVTRDVTELWLAQKSLVEADRHNDECLATLSHGLRSSLAPIRNCLEFLDSPSVDAAARQDARDVIHQKLEQLTRLVDELLDVSHLSPQ